MPIRRQQHKAIFSLSVLYFLKRWSTVYLISYQSPWKSCEFVISQTILCFMKTFFPVVGDSVSFLIESAKALAYYPRVMHSFIKAQAICETDLNILTYLILFWFTTHVVVCIKIHKSCFTLAKMIHRKVSTDWMKN